MVQVEKSIEVAVPIQTVYVQWTQFEQFPRFMSGVKDVRRLDDSHLHWRGNLWGEEKEWDAQITHQVPDRAIAWRSTTPDAPGSATVHLEQVDTNRTRVRLAIEYEAERAAGGFNDPSDAGARLQTTVESFKRLIEGQGSGAWQGVMRPAGTEPDAAAAGLGSDTTVPVPPAPSEPPTTERPEASEAPERAVPGTQGQDGPSGTAHTDSPGARVMPQGSEPPGRGALERD